MTGESLFDTTSLAPETARHVDDICTRFERAWKRGDRPRIEDFLDDWADVERPALVAELILLEVDYRRALGEHCTAGDYRDRFQGLDPAWLERALATTSAGAAESGARGCLANTRRAAVGPSAAADVRMRSIGDYRLNREIARGGMGVVYEAWHVSLHRRVAIKMILAGDHASLDHRARFRTEARAVARLQHPHIVQIHEVGEHEGRPYLVLEYVDGGSLAERLAGLPQPAKTAARLVEILARAVHFAHEQGVVHRDLKPANVLVTADGSPKIADFGLAKCLDLDAGATGSTTVLGTPSYMAPEQAMGQGRTVGAPADVYALGVILYQMLTGRPPLVGPTPLETVQLVATEEPVAPRSLQRNLPRDLETICLKCLRKDAQRRYESAESLAEDLRRFLAGEPILARRTGPAERAWRWCRRNPAVASLLLLIGLLLAGIAAGSTVAAFREAAASARFEGLAARETEAHKRADQKASEAKAVVDFLVNEMLGAANPYNSAGRKITVDEVLNRAARQIEGRFTDQPLVEASIRQVIGEAYEGLGLPDRHIVQARRARTLRIESLGAEHSDSLRSTLLLAKGLHLKGRTEEAWNLADEVRRVRLRDLGPEDLETADAEAWAAQCINDDPARLEEARKLFTHAIDVLRRRLPADDPRFFLAMEQFAWTLNRQGKIDESLAVYDELIATMRRLRGNDYIRIGRIFDLRGAVLGNAGRTEEAASSFEESVRISTQVHDPSYIWLHAVIDRYLRLRMTQVDAARERGDKSAARATATSTLPLVDDAIARAELWVALDPTNGVAVNRYGLFRNYRYGFLTALEPSEEIKNIERDLTRREVSSPLAKPVLQHLRIYAARRLAWLGLAERGVEIAQVEEDRNPNGVSLFNLARVYGIAAISKQFPKSQSERYANRALELLGRSVDAGYHDKESLVQDENLAVVRSRPGFRALLDRLPYRVRGAIEGESLDILKTSSPFSISTQEVPMRVTSGHWSGDAQLLALPQKRGEWADLALPVPADGTYEIVVYLTRAWDFGIIQLALDGQPLGSALDGFFAAPDGQEAGGWDSVEGPRPRVVGTFGLRQGKAILRIEVIGKNEESIGYRWGLDCVELKLIPRTRQGPVPSQGGSATAP